MSSLATAYFCGEDVLDDLLVLFRGQKPVYRTVLGFMREASQVKGRLEYGLLVVTGLSGLLSSQYDDSDPIVLLKESLRKLSRDTVLVLPVDSVEWSPTKRGRVVLDGVAIKVSEIDLDTTLRVREHLGIGEGRKKDRLGELVIARM